MYNPGKGLREKHLVKRSQCLNEKKIRENDIRDKMHAKNSIQKIERLEIGENLLRELIANFISYFERNVKVLKCFFLLKPT